MKLKVEIKAPFLVLRCQKHRFTEALQHVNAAEFKAGNTFEHKHGIPHLLLQLLLTERAEESRNRHEGDHRGASRTIHAKEKARQHLANSIRLPASLRRGREL